MCRPRSENRRCRRWQNGQKAPFSWRCHSSEGGRHEETPPVVSFYCVDIILSQILHFLDMMHSIMMTAGGNATPTSGKWGSGPPTVSAPSPGREERSRWSESYPKTVRSKTGFRSFRWFNLLKKTHSLLFGLNLISWHQRQAALWRALESSNFPSSQDLAP